MTAGSLPAVFFLEAFVAVVISDLKHVLIVNVSTNPKEPVESSVSLSIVPNSNFFERENLEKWNLVKNHPDVKKYIDEGLLRVIEDPKTAKGAKKGGTPETLEKIDAKLAVDLVKHTGDVDILRKWLDEEDRETVIAALRQQIKDMKEIDEARAKAQAIA